MTDKILIADDDIELCQLLSDFLQLEGFSVNSVHDGKQAAKPAKHQVANEDNQREARHPLVHRHSISSLSATMPSRL